MDGIFSSVRMVSVARVFRSSWASYGSHLRLSSAWVYSIFKPVMFRVIGLRTCSIFGSGGDRGSDGGAGNYLRLIFLGRQDTVRIFSTSFLVEAQVRGTLDITTIGSSGIFVFECRVSGSGIFRSGGRCVRSVLLVVWWFGLEVDYLQEDIFVVGA